MPYKDPDEDFIKSQKNVKYFGKYSKITQFEVDHDCFCSNGDCLKQFELGELVVDDGGNLWHTSCFTNLFDWQTVEVSKEMENNKNFK